jgi:hypothetical protein
MKHIRYDTDLPWLCMGDFNEVLRREEHFSICDRHESQMRGFIETVDVCGLYCMILDMLASTGLLKRRWQEAIFVDRGLIELLHHLACVCVFRMQV